MLLYLQKARCSKAKNRVAEADFSRFSTHLAVGPVISSFSDDEEADEALKKAASVWSGEALPYSGVCCLPSCGMLLKLF